MDKIAHLAIHPTQINLFYEFVGERSSKTPFVDFDQNGNPIYQSQSFLNSSRKANGEISDIAKRKMNKAIDYLVLMANEKKVKERLTGKTITFKVAFVTLTLPSQQIHTDGEIINKCLNQFIIECRKYYQVKNYVWRAEKQKNGNIHFHIILDKFIPWYEMRNRWNRIMNKLGYIDRFQDKHGHTTPNSTDIHSTRKIKDVRKYLAKYMTKNEQQEIQITRKAAEFKNSLTESEEKIYKKISEKDRARFLQMTPEQISNLQQTGRVWACNQELSNIKGCQLDIDNEIATELEKIITQARPRIYETEYFKIFSIDLKMIATHSREVLFKYFCNYLISEFNYYPQLKI